MIRNENANAATGAVTAEIIDLDAGTYTLEIDGVQVESRPMTADEIAAYTPATSGQDPLASAAAILVEPLKATTVAGLRTEVDALLSRVAVALLGE